MKSVQELFENSYPFETACNDLQFLIESSVATKDKIQIPKNIMACFSHNKYQTKKLFSEMKDKGYSISFLEDDVVEVSWTNNNYLELVSYISSDLNSLIDNNTISDQLLKLISQFPEKWNKTKTSIHGGYRKLEYNSMNENGLNFYINLDKKMLNIRDEKMPLDESVIYQIVKIYEKMEYSEKRTIVKFGRNKFSDLDKYIQSELTNEILKLTKS